MFRPLATAAAIVLCLSAQAQISEDTPVIQAGNLSITKSEFERLLQNDARMQQALKHPGGKQALGTEFGKAFALEAEARRRGLDQESNVQLRIRNYTQQLLANELIVSLRRQYLKDEAALRVVYDKNADAYAQPRVRQILVRTPGSEVAARKGGKPELTVAQAKAKAEALLVKLVKGADFAAVAKAESDDGGSRAAGGDMGFVPRGSTAANFEAAAYSLPVGELSQVVQTEFGFHILRVDARQPMAFALMKPSIANELAHAEADKLIIGGYQLNAAYFGGK